MSVEFVKPGQIWRTPQGAEVRIMGVCEGWAMYRRKGAMPSVETTRRILKEDAWEPITTKPNNGESES